MLVGYGCQTVPEDWHVDEKSACGYVRVYEIYSGELEYRDSGGCRSIKPGTICLFPSAVPFSIRHNPRNPLCCTHLHLDIAPAVLRRLAVLDAPEDSLPRRIFAALRISAESGNDRITEQLAAAFEEYCRQQELFPVLDGGISRALRAMSEQVRKNWSVRELSELAGYSESYFIRRFRAEAGASPHQYLISCRMRAAVRLLWDGSVSVSQAAEQAGYPDLKSFSRAFRRHYGLSPSEYRAAGRLFP